MYLENSIKSMERKQRLQWKTDCYWWKYEKATRLEDLPCQWRKQKAAHWTSLSCLEHGCVVKEDKEYIGIRNTNSNISVSLLFSIETIKNNSCRFNWINFCATYAGTIITCNMKGMPIRNGYYILAQQLRGEIIRAKECQFSLILELETRKSW
jgi:hypothetical protein